MGVSCGCRYADLLLHAGRWAQSRLLLVKLRLLLLLLLVKHMVVLGLNLGGSLPRVRLRAMSPIPILLTDPVLKPWTLSRLVLSCVTNLLIARTFLCPR